MGHIGRSEEPKNDRGAIFRMGNRHDVEVVAF